MCVGCHKQGSALCASCGAELPSPISETELPGLARAGSAWFYEGHARDLILALKLRGRRAAALPLGAAIAGWIDRDGTEADVVTWVPGRPRDISMRGFDHAEAIARVAASMLGLRPVPLLRRIADRQDQTTLDAGERRRNLRGAFGATTSPWAPTSPKAATSPKAVLLIDDLMTTGATLIACAEALKAAGAGHIDAVTACRA